MLRSCCSAVVRLAAVVCVATPVSQCSRSSRPAEETATFTAEVDAALAQYERLTLRMEADSLASFFTADGELAASGQPPIVGPSAIATHLRSFSDYLVLADSLRADSTRIEGANGHQVGTYWQRVRVPRGDTIEVRGHFEALWIRLAPKDWRIRRLATRP